MRTLAVALFGFALCLTGATFDAASLYVPGGGLMAIAAGATAWVALAARTTHAVAPPAIAISATPGTYSEAASNVAAARQSPSPKTATASGRIA